MADIKKETAVLKTGILVMAVLILALTQGCATRQDFLMVYNQGTELEKKQVKMDAVLLDMETKLKTDLAARQKQARALRDQVAKMRAESDALRGEVRSLMGKMEETGFVLDQKVGAIKSTGEEKDHTIKILEERLAKMTGRLARMEGYMGMETGETTVPVKTEKTDQPVKDITPMKDLDENEAYKLAKNLFDKGNFDEARKNFREYLKLFPKSDKADNAWYWTGETYFQEKWYEKAILEYQHVIEDYPKGNKTPAALFKQGLSFARLKDTGNARLIWQGLISKYPGSPEALLAKKRLKTLGK